jgi:hypothetical protein
MELLKKLFLASLALISAPALGWFSLWYLPSLGLPTGNAASIFSVLAVGSAFTEAFLLGFLQPRIWHVLGVAMALPPVVLGFQDLRNLNSNLGPPSAAALIGLGGVLVAIAYLGSRHRIGRSAGNRSNKETP